jgi:hypothetical protein
MRAYSRLSVPAIAAVAALAFSGCGGDDGGNEADYVKTYETACKAVNDEVAALQKSVTDAAKAAGSDQTKIVPAMKSGMTKLFDTFGTQIKAMADADAPKEFEKFQDSVEKGSEQVQKGITQVKSQIAKANTPQQLGSVLQNIQSLDFGSSEPLPKALGEKAPSCKSLGGSSTAC